MVYAFNTLSFEISQAESSFNVCYQQYSNYLNELLISTEFNERQGLAAGPSNKNPRELKDNYKYASEALISLTAKIGGIMKKLPCDKYAQRTICKLKESQQKSRDLVKNSNSKIESILKKLNEKSVDITEIDLSDDEKPDDADNPFIRDFFNESKLTLVLHADTSDSETSNNGSQWEQNLRLENADSKNNSAAPSPTSVIVNDSIFDWQHAQNQSLAASIKDLRADSKLAVRINSEKLHPKMIHDKPQNAVESSAFASEAKTKETAAPEASTQTKVKEVISLKGLLCCCFPQKNKLEDD